MDTSKDKVANNVKFSQSPWQYSRGPFNIPLNSDKIKLKSLRAYVRQQMLCRLYLLFPKVDKHEIYRLFKMYNADTLKTIDTLLYTEMTRISNMKKYHRLRETPSLKMPRGQCARTCMTRILRKSYNHRNITSGTVYNRQPNESPVPQVQQVLDSYSRCVNMDRFRNFVPNVTFDCNGIRSAVFETLHARADVENKPPPVPLHTYDLRRPSLDSPGQRMPVLRSLLLNNNGTNQTRDSIKMKLYRDGDIYCAEMIRY